MKYCNQCGASMDDYATSCTSCGTPARTTNNPPAQNQGYYAQQPYRAPAPAPAPAVYYPTMPNVADQYSSGLAVLGFFFPSIALILLLIWCNNYPKKAVSCGKGVAIRVVIGLILSLIAFIVMVSLGIGFIDLIEDFI